MFRPAPEISPTDRPVLPGRRGRLRVVAMPDASRGGEVVAGPPTLAGWRVVAGAFMVQMVGYGAAYSFAAFAGPLAAEFGVTHAQTSLVYALSSGVALLLSGVSGRIADRYGSRGPAVAGMLLVAAGLLLAAGARSFAQLLACYGLLIGCGIGLAYVPALAAVQRWFDRRRGLASGIAVSGSALGTALVPPMAGLLLGLDGGWRLAFQVSGVAAALCGVAGALLLARAPDGMVGGGAQDAVPVGGATGPRPGAFRLPAQAKTRRFALLYAGCLLVSLPIALPFAHLPTFAAWVLHMRPEATLHLLMLIGFSSLPSRFVLGALADLVGRGRVFLVCSMGVALGTAGWAMSDTMAGMRLFAVVFGITYGGFISLLPAFVADLYGRGQAGTMIGLLYSSRGLALLLAPPLVALAAEVAESPVEAIGVVALLGLGGTALIAWAGKPDRS